MKINNTEKDNSFSFKNYISPSRLQAQTPIKSILKQSKYKLNAFLNNLKKIKPNNLLRNKENVNNKNTQTTKQKVLDNFMSQIETNDENVKE